MNIARWGTYGSTSILECVRNYGTVRVQCYMFIPVYSVLIIEIYDLSYDLLYCMISRISYDISFLLFYIFSTFAETFMF